MLFIDKISLINSMTMDGKSRIISVKINCLVIVTLGQ